MATWKQGVDTNTVIYMFSFMIFINTWLYYLYVYYDKFIVLSIVAITQASDIYQYIVGYCCTYTNLGFIIGNNKIGGISKNKTYQGYVGGFILTYLTFIYFYDYVYISGIYFLGISGGLISSYFKRQQGIKDYSNLLGPHGGWIDRTDSIILPAIFAFFLY
jgi:phosphatidate cytidylyltransferase